MPTTAPSSIATARWCRASRKNSLHHLGSTGPSKTSSATRSSTLTSFAPSNRTSMGPLTGWYLVWKGIRLHDRTVTASPLDAVVPRLLDAVVSCVLDGFAPGDGVAYESPTTTSRRLPHGVGAYDAVRRGHRRGIRQRHRGRRYHGRARDLRDGCLCGRQGRDRLRRRLRRRLRLSPAECDGASSED